MIKKIFLLWVVLLLSACNSVETRLKNADSISSENHFKKKSIHTELFKLVSFQKITHPSKTAVIYIEGDGFAWKNKYQVSPNPTPNNPVALNLATIDSSSIVVYIARPCQYVDLDNETNCHFQYWTNKRASEEVIQSINSAIEIIKNELMINKIRLVGFSGGATIAAILAARRNDVVDLRTVAGNLDIDKFIEVHNVSPLTGSVNPTNYANKLIHIPQTHFLSKNDTVITDAITNSYLQSLKALDQQLSCVRLVELKKPEHTKGWESSWANQNFKKIQTCTN